jgi:predicted RNase H-like nuclease
MTYLAGVDGCRGGWIAALRTLGAEDVQLRRVNSLAELLCDGQTPDVAAVDIPIGLADAGPRACDGAARRLLGRRGSSIFPAPVRAVLAATDYAEACRLGQAADGRKVSRQTYNLLPKIQEVDDLLRRRQELARRVHEVHPELSFCVLAGGRPMEYSKKRRQGLEERLALLEPHYGSWIAAALSERKRLGCTEDDIVDALIALWTAERIAHGVAQTFPSPPPTDRHGLTMAITA